MHIVLGTCIFFISKAKGGIDGDRIAIMERADYSKSSLFTRWDNHPAGTEYVEIHDVIAMVHALEILSSQQRKGVGAIGARHAAIWALAQNAHSRSVICANKNKTANALYTSLRMRLVGGYHYRIREERK